MPFPLRALRTEVLRPLLQVVLSLAEQKRRQQEGERRSLRSLTSLPHLLEEVIARAAMRGAMIHGSLQAGWHVTQPGETALGRVQVSARVAATFSSAD